jgi:hypothetical protein
MPKKKPPNWEDIKTRRIVNGESWEAIREVYDVPLGTLKNRASREKWSDEALRIGTEIRAEAEDDLKALCTATIKVHRKFMERMLKKDSEGNDVIEALEHAFLTDGERVNSLFQTAMNNSVKILQAHLKAQEDNPEEEEPPGFIVSPDV